MFENLMGTLIILIPVCFTVVIYNMYTRIKSIKEDYALLYKRVSTNHQLANSKFMRLYSVTQMLEASLIKPRIVTEKKVAKKKVAKKKMSKKVTKKK